MTIVASGFFEQAANSSIRKGYNGADYVIGVGIGAEAGVNCDLAFTDETETYDLNPVIENVDISVIHIKNFKSTGDFTLNVATITVKPTNAKTFVKVGSNDIVINSGAVFIDNGTDDAWIPFEFNGFSLMVGANNSKRQYIVNTPGYVIPYSESFSGNINISGANVSSITNNSSGGINISGATINTITNNSSGSITVADVYVESVTNNSSGPIGLSGAYVRTVTNHSSGWIYVTAATAENIINNSSGTVAMENSKANHYVCNNANAILRIPTGYSFIHLVEGNSSTVKIAGDSTPLYYGQLMLSHPGTGTSKTYYLSGYIVFHKPVTSISINVTAPAVAKAWDA
jgi:hypothetical protein